MVSFVTSPVDSDLELIRKLRRDVLQFGNRTEKNAQKKSPKSEELALPRMCAPDWPNSMSCTVLAVNEVCAYTAGRVQMGRQARAGKRMGTHERTSRQRGRQA